MIFPVTQFRGRLPVVTQEFNLGTVGQAHHGIDVMFRYSPDDPDEPEWMAAYFGGKPRFSFPRADAGPWVVAPWPGEILYATDASNGWRVRLAHDLGGGVRVDTVHLHLRKLLVPLRAKGDTTRGDRHTVSMGQIIGLPGHDRSYKLPHLHYETRMVRDQPSLLGRDYRGMEPVAPQLVHQHHWSSALPEMQAVIR